MSEPFISEIKIVSFVFAPRGWAFCNGQLLPINQNQALFSLLGTTYGGNGQTNFALPDLRGCVPIHTGNGHVLGERGGATSHTLTLGELPTHSHTLQANGQNATSPIPGTRVLAAAAIYGQATGLTPLHPDSTSAAGGGQAHLNIQPYETLNFIIALQGIFPSQN